VEPSNTTISYREVQRRAMVYKTPKDKQGRALCHCCNQKPGSQMHELINRAQGAHTQLIFAEELCSWLCPQCHDLAPRRDIEAILWTRNMQVYGEARVQEMINQVREALGFQPIMELP